MVNNRSEDILNALYKTYGAPKRIFTHEDPFQTLIMTIISQNSSAGNAAKAYAKLSNKFKITPEALGKGNIRQIEECLRVGGLYRNKAKTIKNVARTIFDRYEGNISQLLDLSFEQARKQLMQFQGVGPKTADVVLLFSAGKRVIPVDTHVNRVSKRLGFTPVKGKYEEVRKNLEALYDSKNYAAVHLLLILHGRRCCKARNPLCKDCQISIYCPSKSLWDRND